MQAGTFLLYFFTQMMLITELASVLELVSVPEYSLALISESKKIIQEA